MGLRRARVAQVLVMQAGLAVILLVMAWFSRADRRSMVLYLATLLVPMGWAYGVWTGHAREERARAERRWTPELAKRERNRAIALLGGSVALWIALALAIVVLL